MRLGKTASIEQLQTVSRFEGLRQTLLSEAYARHLDRPLACWALPSDRCLPLALLGRTLRDLVNTPFVELSATPGIGRKKTASLIHLLARAADTDPAQLPTAVTDAPRSGSDLPSDDPAGRQDFDPVNIAELTWAQWQASVVRHGLGGETLGRFAPSLQRLSHVIWDRLLGEYVNCTLADMRALKTHGDKRVRAIVEVFYAVHTLVGNMGAQDHLRVRLVPWRIDQAEQWIGRTLQRPGIPSQQEIFAQFVAPLLDQVRVDATDQIARLAEDRLGMHGPITSVRQAARTLGLTRARVYQLLNEINDIMVVRWPTGRHQSHALRQRLQTEAAEKGNAGDIQQFCAAVELFYPGSRLGADGPLEMTAARRTAEKPTFPEDELLEVS